MPSLVESGVEFDVETIARALVNIYKQQVDIDHDIEQNLYRDTLRIMGDAMDNGFAQAAEDGVSVPDQAFRDAFTHSAEVFSAFRVHKMQNDIAAQMLDSDGNVKPFSRFVKDVSPYIEHRNRAWLRTEYDTAIIRARNAAEWQQFQDEKDVYPNLEWIPSTSPNPGADHRVFWGTVLPVDDPFWDEHKPGDRWNCKCELRQTDKGCTAAPSSDGKSDAAPGLESNPAKDKELFSDNHPYFPISCSTCPFAGNKLMALAHDLAGKGKHCMSCRSVSKCVERSYRMAEKTERLKRITVDTNVREFRAKQKALVKELRKKGRVVLRNKSLYTGHLFFGKDDIDQIRDHCHDYLEIEAAKRIHKILPKLKDGKYIHVDMSRSNYRKKMEIDGILHYTAYDVEYKGVMFVLKCKVCRNGRFTCEYPYCLKEKE